MKYKIEDMRDWLIDYYAYIAEDTTDDGTADLEERRVENESKSFAEKKYELENATDVEIAEEYIYERYGEQKKGFHSINYKLTTKPE